jgi:hypothetical protein
MREHQQLRGGLLVLQQRLLSAVIDLVHMLPRHIVPVSSASPAAEPATEPSFPAASFSSTAFPAAVRSWYGGPHDT